MVGQCEIRGILRTCGRPGVAVCQYCGRTFCDDHGERLADGQEICHRSTCQAKKADLARHTEYKAAVAQRNDRRLCGQDECEASPVGQCSKCRGLFCLAHLEERTFDERRGSKTVQRVGSLCQHCARRRSLWAQV